MFMCISAVPYHMQQDTKNTSWFKAGDLLSNISVHTWNEEHHSPWFRSLLLSLLVACKRILVTTLASRLKSWALPRLTNDTLNTILTTNVLMIRLWEQRIKVLKNSQINKKLEHYYVHFNNNSFIQRNTNMHWVFGCFRTQRYLQFNWFVAGQSMTCRQQADGQSLPGRLGLLTINLASILGKHNPAQLVQELATFIVLCKT